MKKFLNILKMTFSLLLILFIIFFSIINSEIIKINFDFFPFNFILEIRLFLLIIFCLSIGFLFGVSFSYLNVIKNYFYNFKDKRKLEKLEKDITILKNKEENKNE